VHAAFDAAGLGSSRLGWIWSVNHEDVGGFRAEAFFPGDDVVDWVAVDGYNWGASQSWSSWRSPSEVLGDMVGRLRAISQRPLALTETATSSVTTSGSDLGAKSQWVTDLFGYAAAARARMVVWFNADKETDWATFGGSSGDGTFRSGRTSYRTLAAYRAGVNRPEAVSPVSGDPRILTDAQFAGTLP
jgi:beta-mannanase